MRCGQADLCELGDRREFEGAIAPVVEERAVGEDAIDHSEIAGARGAEVETDRPRPLDDVGVLDHLSCRRVGLVVHAGDARVAVDDRFRVTVGSGAAMPDEMIVGEVQAYGRVRHGLTGRFALTEVPELVAGELDDEHIESRGVAHGVKHRYADVSARSGAQPALDEQRRGELRGGRLAVGAGDQHPVRRAPVVADHLVAHPPGHFDIAPQRDAGILRPADDRMRRRESR